MTSDEEPVLRSIDGHQDLDESLKIWWVTKILVTWVIIKPRLVLRLQDTIK